MISMSVGGMVVLVSIILFVLSFPLNKGWLAALAILIFLVGGFLCIIAQARHAAAYKAELNRSTQAAAEQMAVEAAALKAQKKIEWDTTPNVSLELTFVQDLKTGDFLALGGSAYRLYDVEDMHTLSYILYSINAGKAVQCQVKEVSGIRFIMSVIEQ